MVLFSFLGVDFTLLDIIFLCFAFLYGIVMFFRTGDRKIFKEVLEEMVSYKTAQTALTAELKGEEFQQFKPVYRLNKVTGELEKTDEVIDIVEFVNSFKDVALQSVLERFMPDVQNSIDNVFEYKKVVSDLDIMQESANLAEEYRLKYGLSDDLSISDVFSYVQKLSVDLKDKIKKEVVINETQKDRQESKSEDVSANG